MDIPRKVAIEIVIEWTESLGLKRIGVDLPARRLRLGGSEGLARGFVVKACARVTVPSSAKHLS